MIDAMADARATNAELLRMNAQRLGCRPLPLAAGEVAELTRSHRARFSLMALQLLSTAGAAALVAAVLWGA